MNWKFIIATLIMFLLSSSIGTADGPAGPVRLNAYAAPNAWGPQVDLLPAHLGEKTYKVVYEAVGDTLVLGEVEYVGLDGKKVKCEFKDEIVFTRVMSSRFRGCD